MTSRTVPALLATTFVLALAQLLAVVAGWAPAIVCGALIPLLAWAIFHFLDIEVAAWWMLGITTLASVVGVAVAAFAGADVPIFVMFAPMAAAACAGAKQLVERRQARRCALCNSRLGQTLAFPCPRCGLLVCERSCWVFERSRCRLCEQNGVRIFVEDGRWWDRQLGPRTMHGRCQLCLEPASDTDLRACPKCGRPQCRECWDASNGECTRCHWTIPDLPPSLQPFVLAGRGQAPARPPDDRAKRESAL
jgi:hypothetical protein